MTYRVAHRRPVSGSSQATEPAVRGQRFPQFVVYAIGGPDQNRILNLRTHAFLQSKMAQAAILAQRCR